MVEPITRTAIQSEDLFRQAQQLISAMRAEGLNATDAKGVCLFGAVMIAKMNDQTLEQFHQDVGQVWAAITNDRTVN